MKNIATWIARTLLAGTALLAGYGAAGTAFAADEIKIVTVMDNEVVNPDLKTDWGFGAAVLTPKDSLLFDTGPDGAAFLSNLARLGLEPRQFSKLMISHTDEDHSAGIPAVVAANPKIEVFLPGRALGIENMVKDTGAVVHNVMEPGEVAPGLFTTGPMDTTPEQALLIVTKDGLVVMTGCAHPGIVDVIKEAEHLHPNKRMLLVMGGFHLFRTADTRVDAIVDSFKALKVEKVAPSHCSGRYARTRFKQVFGDDYIAGGVGLTLTFPAP
jgi:7,8-dihydropterin-6-yl-methyl-4-(beta-D-ribofuranosyl)aminobenzene 5'-phosphate synthase